MKAITIIITTILIPVIFSCKENHKEIEVKVADEHSTHATKKLDVEVVNVIDPVCEMETATHLSDTIHYAGKVYGFCSESCKNEFAKNPENYLDKQKENSL